MSPQETGSFISSLRKEAGLTQEQLANKLNVTAKAVSRWETGKGYPDITIFPEIAKFFNISVNELFNGCRCTKETATVLAEQTIINVCHQAKQYRRRSLKLIIIISAVAILLFSLLCGFIIRGIAKSMEGEFFAVLSNDLSSLTYYGEVYVPFDINGYSCRLGEEIVDELKVEGYTFFDKLFSEYVLQEIKGVADNDLLYLRSEHDIKFFVKEAKHDYYENIINEFSPISYFAVFEQSNCYEKELVISSDLFDHLYSLTETDIDKSMSCALLPDQKRMTVIAYSNEKIFYKECGDIFVDDGRFYWYDYAESEFPDSVAYKMHPYIINEQYSNALKNLFSYYDSSN